MARPGSSTAACESRRTGLELLERRHGPRRAAPLLEHRRQRDRELRSAAVQRSYLAAVGRMPILVLAVARRDAAAPALRGERQVERKEKPRVVRVLALSRRVIEGDSKAAVTDMYAPPGTGPGRLWRMPTSSQRFLYEVARFKAWAALLPATSRSGDWECDYEHWPELQTGFEDFLVERSPEQWTVEETDAVLYAVARDNEVELLAARMSAFPEHLLAAARASVGSSEPYAKWQLAEVLTKNIPDQAHVILEALSSDDDEYVRRRVLLLLGRLRSPLIEGLVDKAWETGDEYQRIASLHALHDAGSARLQDFLSRADADGRQYLVENARKLRSS